MFDAVRKRLGSLRFHTDHPPPEAEDVAEIRRIRAVLEALSTRSPRCFRRCFLGGRQIRVARRDRAPWQRLAASGLVGHVVGPIWVPHVRILSLAGRFIASDLATYAHSDQVFSPMFEQVYFVRQMDVRPPDDVLEIGVGSGVLSLFAAATARRVTAVDRNPRALAFARWNGALNPGISPIDLRHGSLFGPLRRDEGFDLILSNPPFEPVPPGETHYEHSAGGEDGLSLVRELLTQLPAHLNAEGRFEIITWSPGTERRALLVDLIRDALPRHTLDVDVLEVQPMEDHTSRFRSNPNHGRWVESLARRELTHIHFLFVRAVPAAAPEVSIRYPEEEVAACHAISDDWIA